MKLFPFPFVHRRVDGWQVIELGVAAATIQTTLMAVRQETGLVFQGYADLTTTEVAHITGLDAAAAAQAQQREYSETIVTPLSAEALTQLEAALAQRGLTIVSGGKFYTVMGAGSDKGRAVTHLTALYRPKLGHIVQIRFSHEQLGSSMLKIHLRPSLKVILALVSWIFVNSRLKLSGKRSAWFISRSISEQCTPSAKE